MTSLTTLLVSDTHIGHDLGLKSDTAVHKDKISDFANSTQEVLFEAWKEMAKKYRDPDCLILNGDIVDLLTISRKENEMWSQNGGEILREATKLIKMIGKPKRTFVIKGTSAHVDSIHLTLERDLAEELDAYSFRNRKLHKAAVINLAPAKAKPALYHITHHMSATSGWYRGTAPAKAMVSLMLNEAHFIDRKVYGKILGIIRSHVHHYWYEESDSRHMIVNPCWQGQTNFMIEKMPESPPDIGSVIVRHYDDGFFEKERFKVPVDKLRPPVFSASV